MKPALDKLPSKRVNLDRLTVYIDPLDGTQEYTGINFFKLYFFRKINGICYNNGLHCN